MWFSFVSANLNQHSLVLNLSSVGIREVVDGAPLAGLPYTPPPSPSYSLFLPLSPSSSFSLPLFFPSLSLASEENAAELKKAILAKVGTITDVVASIGEFWAKGPILDQTLEEYRKVRPLGPTATQLVLPRIDVY